ncbi:hypothetical protein [Wenzhouxiangella marina]|uniref:Uncharacterized protein n=1 Tax=Wenzhouxiangella marina TaxID=1579979 RepID=A0A0K0XXF3_9GAMM|nr:hypothetical protein [Wenzhouxiangella marina]AKS42379.1 hypothetical protein WM2015_2013 [Wenzhouxiangella marina]MBB6085848.1 hypothetical protein [Wenzhouxiangella marina]
MNTKRLFNATVLAFALSSPVMAHHPAEDIISDDVWQRIDDMLEAADSPHLTLDFDDAMGSMGVASTGGASGGMALATTVTVYSEAADEYLIYVDEAIDMVQAESAQSTGSRSGSDVFVEAQDLGNGFTEITLYEPIGSASTPGASRSR